MTNFSVGFARVEPQRTSGSLLPCLYGLSLASTLLLPFCRGTFGVPSWSYALPMLAGAIIVVCQGSLSPSMGRRRSMFFLAGISGMAAWLLLSAAWTISVEEYVHDAQQLVLLVVLAVIALAGATREGAEWTGRYLVMGGAIVTAFIVRDHLTAGHLRGYGTELNERYLSVSMAVGSATVFSSIRSLYDIQRVGLWRAGAAVNAVGLSLGLGRGALIFAGAIIMIGVLALWLTRGDVRLKRRRVARRRKITAGLVGALMVAAMVWGAFQVERTESRLAHLVSGRELSKGGRSELWLNSIRGVGEAPFLGRGIGSNGRIAGGDEKAYPHNFALQLLLDGGLVGLGVATVWLICPFAAWRQYRAASGGLPIAWLGVYVFFLLESSKSYDFYGCRGLVLAGAITVSLVAAVRR